MPALPGTFFVLTYGLGNIALVAVLFGTIERLKISPALRSALLGLAFGLGAVLAMTSPFRLSSGVIIDTRLIFVGFAGAFGGVPALLVTVLIAAAGRLLVGGVGLVPGLAGIAIAGAAGLLWAVTIRERLRNPFSRLIVLGLMLCTCLSSALLLPPDLAAAFFIRAAPIVAIATMIAALLLGTFIERERRLIARERQFAQEARTDLLTGLLNRRGFEEAVRAKLAAAAPGSRHALLVVDIDRFKSINDAHGHQYGDVVIKSVGAILDALTWRDELVGRIGGDEFAILLSEASDEQAAALADRIKATAEGIELDLGGRRTLITVSVGASTAPAPTTFPRLFREADLQLYRVKNSGRNSVAVAPVTRAA